MRRAALALVLTLVPAVARAEDEPPPPPRVAFGARAGLQRFFFEGDGSPSDLRGYVLGLDATVRLGPHISLAPVVELSILPTRGDRLEPGPDATSLATFFEARLDTNPAGPWSFRIEAGPGYRWLWLPYASSTTDRFSGLEPLRVRLGPSLRLGEQGEIALIAGAGFGWFWDHSGGRSCAVTATCGDSFYDSDTQTAVHFVGDVSIVVRGWP
jgi:hypothetical protein